MRIFKKSYVLLLIVTQALCGLSGQLFSQRLSSYTNSEAKATTNLFSCDFEAESQNSQWTLTTNSTNNLCIGSTVSNAGLKSLYVTNDNGTTYGYSITATSYSYAYIDLGVLSLDSYVFTYTWKCVGEAGYDYARFFLAPIGSLDYSTTNNISSTTLPSGCIDIHGGRMSGQSTWKNETKTVSISYAQHYYLVVYWYNDYSVSNGDPFAIDDIVVTSESTTCLTHLLPLTEGFEGSQLPPTCWTIVYGDNNPSINTITYDATIYSEGSHSLRFSSYSNSSDYNQYLISPELSITEDNAQFSFDYQTRQAADYLYVGTSTTTNDVSAFTWSGALPTNTYSMSEYVYNLTPGVKYVAIKYYGSYCWYAYVDNIKIQTVLCDPVTNLSVTDIYARAATIAWVSDASEWEYVCSTSPISDFTSVSPIVTTATSVSLTGLQANTRYYIYVRSVCGNLKGIWSNTTFVTSQGCQDISNLRVESNTSSSVTLNWDYYNQFGWQIAVSTVDDVNSAERIIDVNTYPYFVVENLSSSVHYYFFVRSYCSENDYGNWFEIEYEIPCGSSLPIHESFESNECPPPCWTIVYGDDNPLLNSMEHNEGFRTDGDKSFRFSSYSSSLDYNQYLISPELSLSQDAWFYFDYYLVSGYDDLYVGFSSTDSNVESYTWEKLPNVIQQEARYESLVPASTKYFAIRYNAEYSAYYAYVDNIELLSYRKCFAPENIRFYNVVATSAKAAWEMPSDCATSWRYIIGESPITSMPSYATTTTYQSCSNNYLYPNTEYYFGIQSVCEYGVSEIVNATFTTLPACMPVEDLYVVSTAARSVTIDWNPVADEIDWEINIKDEYDNYLQTVTTTTHPCTISGLTPGVVYHLSVSSHCSNGYYGSEVEIEVETVPTCFPVMNFQAETTPTVAVLNWTEGGNETKWQLVVSETELDDPSEATGLLLVTSNEYSITDLTPETEYNCYIRAYCSATDMSAWRKFQFQTEEACPAPYNINIEAGAYFADMSWDAEYASGWEVIVTQGYTPDFEEEQPIHVTTNHCHLSGLVPDTYYVVYVRSDCGSNGYSEWSSSALYTLEACPAVGNLHAENITTSSAEIFWIEYGSASTWQVVISETQLDDPTDGDIIYVDDIRYLFTSLNEGANYYAYVRAYCNPEFSPWMEIRFRTRTNCNISFPLTEDFEGNSVPPDCWSVVYGGGDESNEMICDSENASEGSYSFRFSSYFSSEYYDQYLISPELNLTRGGVLTFDYKMDRTDDYLYVGYSSASSSISDFSFSDAIPYSGNFTNYESLIPAGTKYIAIKYYGEYQYYAWVDNIVISNYVTCLAPSNMLLSNIGSNSVTVEWDANGASQWQVALSLEEIIDFESISADIVTSASYTFESLISDTVYYAYFKTYCSESEQSSWQLLNFRTTCDNVISAPYLEDFNNTPLVYTGVLYNCLPSCIYGFTDDYNYNYSPRTSSSDVGVSFRNDKASYLVMPPFEEPYDMYYFSWKDESVNFSCSIEFGYMFNMNKNTFVSLETYNTVVSYNDYLERIIILQNYDIPDNAQIALRMRSDNGWGIISIDDIYVDYVPNCLPVTNAYVSFVTNNSATIAWPPVAGASGYSVTYDTGYDTESVTIQDTTITINGLSSNSIYYIDFTITTNCGSEDAFVYTTNLIVNTRCDVIVVSDDEPFRENFSNYDIPECWETNSDSWDVYYGEAYCETYNDNVRRTLITPEFDLSQMTSAVLDFYQNVNEAGIRVFVSTDGGVTFGNNPIIDNYQTSETNSRIDVSEYIGSNVVFAFDVYGDGEVYIDEIKIVPRSNENDILYYDDDFVDVDIDSYEHTVTVLLNGSKDITSITPTIIVSNYATISPASREIVDLSAPIIYIVTAENGQQQEWTVYASQLPVNTETDIIDIDFAGIQTYTIDNENHVVNVTAMNDVNITSIAPIFTLSDYATIFPESNVAMDFTNPVIYMVTAEDGIHTQLWSVEITKADPPLGHDCEHPEIVEFNQYGYYQSSNLYCSEYEYLYYKIEESQPIWVRATITNNSWYLSYDSDWHKVSCDGDVIAGSSIEENYLSTREYVFEVLPNTPYYLVIGTGVISESYDVTIEIINGCISPFDIQSSVQNNDGYYTINLSWDQEDVEGKWNVVYGSEGFNPNGTYVSWTDIYEPSYQYITWSEGVFDFYVRSECGIEDYGEWRFIRVSTDDENAPCRKVEDVHTVFISESFATIDWADHGETSWRYAYKLPEQEWSEIDEELYIDRHPYTITGLQQGQTYNFRLSAQCGEDDYSEPEYFSITVIPTELSCDPISEFPYVEDFTSETFPPECWSQERLTAGTGTAAEYPEGAWTRSTSSIFGNETPKAQMRNTRVGSEHVLVSKPILAEASNGYYVSLDVYRSATSEVSEEEGVEIWVNTIDELSSSAVFYGFISRNYRVESDFPAENSAGWYTYKMRVDMSGLMYVIIKGISQNTGAIYIDNLKIDLVPECMDPTDIVLADINSTSAIFSWSDEEVAESYNVRYSIDGGETETLSVDENLFVITDLEPATTYQIAISVQTDCGTSQSEWTTTNIEFTTNCSVLSLPLVEDFETNGALPNCWTICDVSGNPKEGWSVVNGNAYIAETEGVTLLVSPKVDFESGEKFAVDFEMLQQVGSSSSKLLVYVNDLPTTNSARIIGYEYLYAETSQWVRNVFSVPSDIVGEKYVLFAVDAEYDNYSIDNIQIRAKYTDADIVEFVLPNQYSNAEIDAEAHTVSIKVIEGSSMSQIPQIRVSDFATISPASDRVQDFSAPVTYRVTAENADYSQTWVVTAEEYDDPCANPTPQDVNIVVNASSITININQIADETGYNVKISSSSINPFTQQGDMFNGTIGLNESTIPRLNLIEGVQYYIYVQSNCGTQAWISKTFARECVLVSLPYYEDFNDASMMGCWTIVDANNDGKTWTYVNGAARSKYSNTLTANDWLITPKLAVVDGTTLQFDYKVENYAYPEVFSVWVISDNPSNYESATQVMPKMTVNNESYETIPEIDLSEYAGQQVYVAVKAESQAGRYYLYIDNFKVLTPQLTITASVTGAGTITPSGQVSVPMGQSQRFDFAPLGLNELVSVYVDGVDRTQNVNNNSYTFNNVSTDHEIVVNFTNAFVIVAEAGENGTITPQGNITVGVGTNYAFTITPDEGYTVESLLVDDEESIGEIVDGVYTFVSVDRNHTIYVTFRTLNEYTITASATDGGTISPSGTLVVTEEDDVDFAIAPNQGYHTTQILVDGQEADIVDTYTFTNVKSDHTIEASFEINTYRISVTPGTNGIISPSSDTIVPYGSDVHFTFTPIAGYQVSNVYVDGISQGAITEYTFTSVDANHTITADFINSSLVLYTISATGNGNGAITPGGNVTVVANTDARFEINPAIGHHVVDVLVDGASQGVISEYTFNNVTANHSISATFEPDAFVLVATATENGSISPSGNIDVIYGDTRTFTCTPDEGYRLSQLLVDGSPAHTQNGSYTFNNIDSDHTIHAIFAEIPQFAIITNVIGGTATVTPGTTIPITGGENCIITVTPDLGYRIDSLVVDNVNKGAIQTYTFINIAASHVINVYLSLERHVIVASASEGGSISPSGYVFVNYGESKTFYFLPDNRHKVECVLVDGDTAQYQVMNNAYIFNRVSANHNIKVIFSEVEDDAVESISGADASVMVYPNPSNGRFNVEFANIDGEMEYQIIDVRGAIIDSRKLNVMFGEVVTFEYNLQPATYFVRIINDNKVYVNELIINNR